MAAEAASVEEIRRRNILNCPALTIVKNALMDSNYQLEVALLQLQTAEKKESCIVDLNSNRCVSELIDLVTTSTQKLIKIEELTLRHAIKHPIHLRRRDVDSGFCASTEVPEVPGLNRDSCGMAERQEYPLDSNEFNALIIGPKPEERDETNTFSNC